MRSSTPAAFLLFSLACLASTVLGDWKDDVGFTQLAGEVGAGLETGDGVVVSMAEALFNGSFLPNSQTSQFTGKTIIDGSGTASGVSGHATGVANIFFGNSKSISPGVDHITVYEADHWLYQVLGAENGSDPAAQNFRIMNNSWIGFTDTNAESVDLLQRADHVVDRDELLMISGLLNGSNSSVPDLMAHGYNSLIVGRTDGIHSPGVTSFNGAGRAVPHIVAPAGSTSNATPMVSSAAAILHEKTTGTDATRSEVMRAVLMAGATKSEFPTWDRTEARPIDEQFGAGELNVYNSYKILDGGQFSASSTMPSFAVGLSGWDYVDQITTSDTLYYNFEVDSGFIVKDFSISLNWNLGVIDGNASPDTFEALTSLANLEMRFFDSTGSFLGTLLDSSLSPFDNFEYFAFDELTSGTYTLEITSASGSTDYGLAWSGRLAAVPEPSALFALAGGAAACGLYSRRRRKIA